MSRVFIVGSAVVGSTTGRGLLRLGHQVTFVDADTDRIAALTAEGLDARPCLDLDGEAESFVLLCLPTHLVGDRYQLGDLESGAVEIGLALADADARHTVVLRSDVPPGSTEHLVRPLIESCSAKREGEQFGLAVSPDVLPPRPGRPAITVIGARSQAVAHQVRELLRPLGRPGDEVRLFDEPATVELIKCTDTLFSAAKITFWQEIWEVCCVLELNPDQVAQAVAASAEASFNPIYGLRRGAPQRVVRLPRDTRGFLGFAAELGLPIPLLSAVFGVKNSFDGRRADAAEAADAPDAADLNGIAAVCAVPRTRSDPDLVAAVVPPYGRIPRQTRLSGPPV